MWFIFGGGGNENVENLIAHIAFSAIPIENYAHLWQRQYAVSIRNLLFTRSQLGKNILHVNCGAEFWVWYKILWYVVVSYLCWSVRIMLNSEKIEPKIIFSLFTLSHHFYRVKIWTSKNSVIKSKLWHSYGLCWIDRNKFRENHEM